MNRRSTKAAVGLAAAALAAGLSISAAGAAHADPIVPATWAEIYNPYLNAAGNTLCVDDPSGSTAQFQKLQLWRCHGYASNGSPQRWVFTHVGNDALGGYGTYQIRNTGSGWCIGVSPSVPNSQLEGTDLIQESCADTAHTEWDIAPPNRADSTSPFELELAPGPTTSAGWCFSASTFLDTSGTRLVASACNFQDTRRLFNFG